MSYNKKDWHNLPDMSTPISATNLNHMEEGIADANGAIGADAYDSTATYAINDLCIKDNTLYICTTAITTAEAWNSAHWKAITIDDMLISKIETNNIVTELNKKIDVSNIEGTATTTKDGLMSKEDKAILSSIGLGTEQLKRYTGELNNITTSRFVYAADCTYNGISLTNGYILTLIYNSNYKVQFYISASSGALQYRRQVNGTWGNFTNV